jgi:predicted acetyltransferase
VDISIRGLVEADGDDYLRVDGTGFSFHPSAEMRREGLASAEWDRMLGAFDARGEICGSAGAYSQQLTLPGGAQVPVPGVTAVAVLPTHRRRGVLTALMAAQLDDVVARGEALAVLNASEPTIYRRFGYGIASLDAAVRVDSRRSTFAVPVDPALSLRMIDDDEAIEVAPAVFRAHVAAQVGAMTRPDGWWPGVFSTDETWRGGGDHFTVLCESSDGVPAGYAIYRAPTGRPPGQRSVIAKELVAANPEVAAALWRFLLDIDLTYFVEMGAAPVDDPVRWRLVDQGAYQVTGDSDFLWVRILDPVPALAARCYGAADSLVVEVADPFRPQTAGCFRVTAGSPDAATGACRAEAEATDDEPDLVMDIAELGSLYLGGVDASTLVRAGRIDERTRGAVARADRFFAAEHRPFCITRF